VPKHIATWNTARSVWETGQASLFCEHSAAFSAIWPISGMTRAGTAFERQIPVLRMSGTVLSSGRGDETSLLPTPDASHFEGRPETWTARRQRSVYDPATQTGAGNGFGLTIGMISQLFPTPDTGSGKRGARSEMPSSRFLPDGRREHALSIDDVTALLPTPTTRRGQNETATRKPGSRHHDGRMLDDAAVLLPTPQTYEGSHGGSQHPDKRRDGNHQVYLSDVIEHELMPTPRGTDGAHGGPNARGSAGDPMLSGVAAQLPTPTATDSHGHKTNNRNEPVLPGIAARLPTPTTSDANGPGGHGSRGGLPDLRTEISKLPTPAARDWKSGHSNLLGTNSRPLNEIVQAGGLLPTPAASDSTAGQTSRSGERSGEMLLGGIARTVSRQSSASSTSPELPSSLTGETALATFTAAMLTRVSFGVSAATTTRKRSKRGKRSPEDEHPSLLSLIDEATTD